MAIRSAVRNSALLTFGILLVGAWTVLQLLAVLDAGASLLEPGLPLVGAGEAVGAVGVAGIVGALVLVGFLGLLFVLFGEVGEVEPAPEMFPPGE